MEHLRSLLRSGVKVFDKVIKIILVGINVEKGIIEINLGQMYDDIDFMHDTVRSKELFNKITTTVYNDKEYLDAVMFYCGYHVESFDTRIKNNHDCSLCINFVGKEESLQFNIVRRIIMRSLVCDIYSAYNPSEPSGKNYVQIPEDKLVPSEDKSACFPKGICVDDNEDRLKKIWGKILDKEKGIMPNFIKAITCGNIHLEYLTVYGYRIRFCISEDTDIDEALEILQSDREEIKSMLKEYIFVKDEELLIGKIEEFNIVFIEFLTVKNDKDNIQAVNLGRDTCFNIQMRIWKEIIDNYNK